MYINKIDELIDKIIDDFYNKIITGKEFSKILVERNFVKYQLTINKLLIDYVKLINEQQIFDIVGNQQSVNIVVEIIKRYLAYYVFLTIGLFYKGSGDTFINNIMEFSKNQPGFNFKIENFFNSENNSNVIKYYYLAHTILTLVDSDANKLEQYSKKPEFKDAITFLNELGGDIVTQNFKLENLSGNLKDQAHNIIKTIILTELYFKQEKKDVYLILESAEKEKGTYTFIDIVIPRTDFIDFNSIEKALSKRDVESGLAYEIYELILQYESLGKIGELSADEKILSLINNKIVIPIADDFLLYHKDTEKYEKQQQIDIKKKKEETKIRYIVNKIDKVTEYYSDDTKKNKEVKDLIEKSFYTPLADRNAILVNTIEDIKIINKLINQGRKTIENNEYYNDLVAYRSYPYVNFKDFKTYGFGITMTQTVNAIRYATFDKQTTTESGKNKLVQLRRGTSGQILNIVGFSITDNITPLECIKAGNMVSIRDITYKQKDKKTKYDNAYVGILKLLKHTLLKFNKERPSVYWILDLVKDKVRVETYEQLGKMTDQEHSKLLTSTLYDDIVELLYDSIVGMLQKKVTNSGGVTVYQFKNIMENLSKYVIPIPKDTQVYNNLLLVAYYDKYYRTIKRYDKNEDMFPGLTGDIIKLPTYTPHIHERPPTIIVASKVKAEAAEEEESGAEMVGAICQHFLTWDRISEIRKKNPNQFNKLLFEFVMQYVIENYEDDFICKSCGTQVNIKNYVLDGTYDDDGRFITLSVPMTVPLEDIPEYEKYKTTIRNIDKLVEKLASISNLQFLLEKSVRNKNPIKSRIIRDAVDMIIIHNNNMKETYKDRSQRLLPKYGISKELTNFFVFELDNNIFIYSSKDKDHYKSIKRNNILVYVLFMIILEFTDSHIIYLIGDKTCNYYLFAKYGFQLFENIQIIKNSSNTLVPIQNYRLLCYIIFYFSCLITKYNIWQYETEDKKVKKFNPVVQKIIIHTIIDLINSILEVYSKSTEKHYMYSMISIRFFQKLNALFQDNDVIKRLKEVEERRGAEHGEKIRTKVIKIKSIPLAEGYTPANYLEESDWFKCQIARYVAKKFSIVFPKYFVTNNITNCETGEFHQWQVKGKTMECKICHVLLNELTYDPDLTDTISANYKYITLRKLAKKYCRSGEFHTFMFDVGMKCDVCVKCRYTDVEKLSAKDLDELEQTILEIGEYRDSRDEALFEKREAKEKGKQENAVRVVNELKSIYSKTKEHKEDYYKYIDDFIELIDSVIGKNININNENIYTKYNTFVINDDHYGYPLATPIIISEKDNKIIYKKDHPFFKKDVLFYTNQKLKMDVFYDAVTLLLLGSKEINKEYELPKKKNVYMKINYSISDRLKLLGYPSRYIDVSEDVDNIRHTYKVDNPQKILKIILSDIGRTRIHNLKQCITYIQRYINRIKYNYQDTKVEGPDNSDKFLEKYRAKLKNITTKKDDDKIFQNWKVVNGNLFFADLDNKPINLVLTKFLLTEDINHYDYHGNLILFYIVEEMGKLLEFNKEKYTQINTAFLLIDIIIQLHKLFNIEIEMISYELKRFNYIIQSKQSYYEADAEYGMEGEREGFYEEYKDPSDLENPDEIEEKETAQEELDALDIDGELDYEIDYEAGVNYEA